MALRSMTGFGRCEIARDGRRIGVEIKTVNHRFLDLSIRAPRFMGCHEKALRDVLQAHLERGHVDVFVRYDCDRPDSSNVMVDMSLASAYATAAEHVSRITGLENGLTAAQILLHVPDVLISEPTERELEQIGKMLVEASENACRQVVAAREKEGAALWEDISPRLDTLMALADEIEAREPQVVAAFRTRLADRMAELAENLPIDEGRIATEASIFADRCNVTEEVTRIRAHVDRFRVLANGQPGQGRSLDFIAQELNREFNTTGSKSQDTDVTRAVLDAKAEVEKIREQIQNIE